VLLGGNVKNRLQVEKPRECFWSRAGIDTLPFMKIPDLSRLEILSFVWGLSTVIFLVANKHWNINTDEIMTVRDRELPALDGVCLKNIHIAFC
jgi:hypothetical protein